jgi:hypothetical protein
MVGAYTQFLKDSQHPCRTCGGPCGVYADFDAEGNVDRMRVSCPKCGEKYELTPMRTPADRREQMERKRIAGLIESAGLSKRRA